MTKRQNQYELTNMANAEATEKERKKRTKKRKKGKTKEEGRKDGKTINSRKEMTDICMMTSPSGLMLVKASESVLIIS